MVGFVVDLVVSEIDENLVKFVVGVIYCNIIGVFLIQVKFQKWRYFSLKFLQYQIGELQVCIVVNC